MKDTKNIKLKQYLDFQALDDDVDLLTKFSVLLNEPKDVIRKMNFDDVNDVLKHINSIEYNFNNALYQMPVRYAKLPFEVWMDIEELSKNKDNPYSIVNEVARVLLYDYSESQNHMDDKPTLMDKINEISEHLLELPVEESLPYLNMHTKKKANLSTDTQHYILKNKMIVVENLHKALEQRKSLKSVQLGAGTLLSRLYQKILLLRKGITNRLQILYLRSLLIKLNSTKQENQTGE